MMAPHWRKRSINAVKVLSVRSRGIRDGGSLTRLNSKLLRGILLQDNRDFSKVCLKTSKCPIMYENGKLYLENYLTCYSCIHAEPHLLYNLPQRCKSEKFEDTLLCQCPLENTLASPSDQKPCLLVLTANNWLYRLSDATGQEMQRVFLSSKHKFKYLSWDVSQEIFYVKSVQSRENPVARQAGITESTLMHLAIFQTFPLEVVGMMEVNKKVFGSGVTDVLLTQGVLAVSYSTKTVKLFNFEHIVKKYKEEKLALGKTSSLLQGKRVGEFPCGIPVNIQIPEHPPVLFQVSCSNNGVQIGGFPWHFIHTPPQKRHQGTHHICSLRDKTLATNGIQNMNCCSIESDVIFFHPDDSGRIIHVGPSTINILKILGDFNGSSAAKVVQHFSMETRQNHVHASQVTVTSSGRTVKRRFQQLDDDPDQENFRLVEYEDDLDLLAVVVTNGADGQGRAEIRLHDNHSGCLLKTVRLSEPWDETFQHNVVFDKDTIVHVEQKKSNFCCHVYKLKA
uniref:DDB1- and CUL4-associated factor 17 n=1 Tax=Doryrhamphus excisus TaxID=161450 RepID=UPI0025ADC065|nr:DDB1- and CUL4-associated factor 17 [Doryrhamphus excisus]XP_057938079.1 DDB1- and CUL4-associated factor 17 [Doryrhamphus excisus]